MLNKEKTLKLFGYDGSLLSPGSNKKIVLICDYCGEEMFNTPKVRNKSNKFCNRDACFKCKFKKREDVSISRDGVANSSQRFEIREKISNASKDRLKSKEYKANFKAIMMEKYGAECAMHVPELVEKQKAALIDSIGVDNPTKNKQIAKKVGLKARQTKIDKGLIKTVNGSTLPELAKVQGFSRSHFGKLVRRYGVEYALSATHSETNLEKLISLWFDNTGIKYEKQFRIGRKFADFKVGNIIIECDGLYWHSDAFLNDDYHALKRNLYIEAGYRPFFFRGDELRDKFPIVQSIIANSLNMCGDRHYARKLKVVEVDFRTATEFIKVNHLMGPTSAVSCSFGLYSGNDLVAIIQMKRTKNNIYDIARFCTSLNTSIVGGFSKLLKAFIRSKSPDKISTFIDLRYGTGDYLSQFGFEEKTCYKSFKWTNGQDTYHRLKFPGSSGYEKGLYKIWDCGQKKFVLNLC